MRCPPAVLRNGYEASDTEEAWCKAGTHIRFSVPHFPRALLAGNRPCGCVDRGLPMAHSLYTPPQGHSREPAGYVDVLSGASTTSTDPGRGQCST